MHRRIPLSMLSEGFVLASPVHDDSFRMLLGAGVEITVVLMTALFNRGIHDVVVAEKDWQRLTAFSVPAMGLNPSPSGETFRT